MPEDMDIALLGFGAVGRALAARLARTDAPVRVVAATDTGGTALAPEGLDPRALLEAKRSHGTVAAAGGRRVDRDPAWAAANATADVAVQLTPTRLDDPSASLASIEAALASGKDVVTAAKDALAVVPDRVRSLEATHAGQVLHGAAVAGSVPLLETVPRAFAGDEVDRVEGLLNGTTTFLLSSMEAGLSRETALARARREGLVEADPTLDLSGRDAAAKAALVHQAVYGSAMTLDRIPTSGVGGIDEAACRQARSSGFAIRLVARVDQDGARVRPVELPRDSPLAVDGAEACVRVTLEGAGPIVLRGPGAGATETASAVISDVLSLASTGRPTRPRERSEEVPA